MRQAALIFLFSFSFLVLKSQMMYVHSITKNRVGYLPDGYTLDGQMMADNARLKLLDPANFGPSGVYKKAVSITDAYQDSSCLTQISGVSTDVIFFFGSFNKKDPWLNRFTDPEIDSLYNWSKRGGKMIISAGQTMANYSSDILNQKWGFSWQSFSPQSVIATPQGLATDIFSGPFGNINSTSQGGSLQGYFSTLPSDVVVLGQDALGQPNLVMDCSTLDIIVGDVDMLTRVGGITGADLNLSMGPTITKAQDRFFANLFVFMDKLQPFPQISDTSHHLFTNTSYNAYQWYRNDTAISGATLPTYKMTKTGTYYVKATFNGGCKMNSNAISVEITDTTTAPPDPSTPALSTIPECEPFIPTGFSPNGDGINDELCVYGNCIKELELRIYDRWGEMVFQSKDQKKCWDGTYNGERLNSAVFAWTLSAKLLSDEQITKKGNLTLKK